MKFGMQVRDILATYATEISRGETGRLAGRLHYSLQITSTIVPLFSVLSFLICGI